MLSSKKALSSSWLKKGVIITITVSMISMILLFFKSTTTNTWRSLRAFRPETILILLGALFLSWLIEGLRIKLIIESLGESINLKEILRINMAALFSGNITPFTSGSVPTQVYLLHKKGAPVGKATAVVTIRIAFSNLFFAIGGPTILFFFRQRIFDELGIQHLSGIINYILFFALFLSALLLFFLLNPVKG